MSAENFSYEQFNSHFPVSRETYGKLELYVALLEKWQKSINLISNNTLPDIWKRHIIDSFQLVRYMPPSADIVDIGCGAGLPGIILAIAGYNVSLVESDGKKVAFLREATRLLDLAITICHQRIEDTTLGDTSTVTARACASVDALIGMLKDELTSSHSLLLLKGKSYRAELAEAEKNYAFDVKIHPSVTDASGAILLLNNIQNRNLNEGAKP